MGEVQNLLVAGSRARGSPVASPCPWSLLGRGGYWRKSKVLWLRAYPPRGGGSGSLAEPVVAAQEGWPLGEIQNHPTAGSPSRGSG